jgi:hypothetical protein
VGLKIVSLENIKKWLRPGIPVISIATIIIIIVIIIFVPAPVIVSKYDIVEMDYTVWESDETKMYDPLNPVFDTIVWVTMIPITENGTTGLMLGLYNNLRGKEKYYNSDLIWLNRCIDQNRDGIDDNTGQPALTYGNSTDLYFDTCLMIQFTILNIQKYTPLLPSFDLTNNLALRIVMIISFIVLGGMAAISIGFFIKNRIQKRKEKPRLFYRKVRSCKTRVLKYGILSGALALSSYLFLNNWLQYPPEVVNMMIAEDSFLIAFLIISTIIMGVGISIVYLLIYRIIGDLIKRKREAGKE